MFDRRGLGPRGRDVEIGNFPIKVAFAGKTCHCPGMTSKRTTSKTHMALSAISMILAVQANTLAQGAKPIVDIRFDAPYSQIANSQGDEWAPTWADDGR
jgi:hypothetical protein